jgi:succinate dehydrogenase/fumarate reductase flavoprotein subunit
MIKNNIDPFREVLEIAVFTHACNGGIIINAKAETDVPGLFACGEAAGGPHGANRVGGMQVASALTFGTIAGQGAAAWARGSSSAEFSDLVSDTADAVRAALPAMRGSCKPETLIATLRDCLWRHTCFDKTESSLSLCEEGIEKIENESMLSIVDTPIDAVRFSSLRRRIEFARVLVQVQRERKESRGPHYRSDYPDTSPSFEHRIIVSREKT